MNCFDTGVPLYDENGNVIGHMPEGTGPPGPPGDTPYIQNGYWWIGGSNTGVVAAGPQGPTGPQGPVGPVGPQGPSGGGSLEIIRMSPIKAYGNRVTEQPFDHTDTYVDEFNCGAVGVGPIFGRISYLIRYSGVVAVEPRIERYSGTGTANIEMLSSFNHYNSDPSSTVNQFPWYTEFYVSLTAPETLIIRLYLRTQASPQTSTYLSDGNPQYRGVLNAYQMTITDV